METNSSLSIGPTLTWGAWLFPAIPPMGRSLIPMMSRVAEPEDQWEESGMERSVLVGSCGQMMS